MFNCQYDRASEDNVNTKTILSAGNEKGIERQEPKEIYAMYCTNWCYWNG